MNAEPHTHTLEVTETASFFHLTYGDQKVSVAKGIHPTGGTQRVLRRKARRLVRRHDRESIKAGVGATHQQRLQADIEKYAGERVRAWGSTPAKGSDDV